jgi:NAD(P)H-hydrate epimerase
MGTALDLPPVSTAQLAAVEAAALRLGLSRAHLVEAAARAAAALARRLLDNELDGTTVVALAGTGIKACVALHALRILHGFGAECSAVLAAGDREMREETAAAASLCESLRIPLVQPRSPALRGAVADASLVLDGLVGVGLEGAPSEPHAALVRLCNDVRGAALALEVPTGLAPDSGKPLPPTLRARATLALGLPVQGLSSPLAWQFTGEVWLCDVGYPPEALDAAGLDADGLFAQNELVRLR